MKIVIQTKIGASSLLVGKVVGLKLHPLSRPPDSVGRGADIVTPY